MEAKEGYRHMARSSGKAPALYEQITVTTIWTTLAVTEHSGGSELRRSGRPHRARNENNPIVVLGLSFWGLGMPWENFPLPRDFKAQTLFFVLPPPARSASSGRGGL
jgi:hypothetical protein